MIDIMIHRFRHRSLGWIGLLLLALMLPLQLGAARSASVAVSLQGPAVLRAGDSASVAIAITVKEGLHAQSHTPLDPSLIPLTVKLSGSPGLELGEPVYPPPTMLSFPALGTVSAYTGKITVTVPVHIKPTAAGPQQLSGSVRYQACNDTSCFPPETQRFAMAINLGEAAASPATQATQPAAIGSAAPPAAAPPAAAPPAPASAVVPKIFGRDLTSNAYPLAFAAAFLVGIIFNAMPCVLPVVPLKIMGFYEVSQHDRAKSLALGAVFSAGLVASFGVLAVLVVALRVLNWGGLFQQTWFTIAIVAVLVVMAFSLFGLFTVNLPTGIYRFAPRHDTYLGNFLFGILTAALSTPCTFGMFVGLLAWALAQPAIIGVALVMDVGVGMAFPYFVLSAFPQVARNFPRTGAWAEVIKQLMGFLLLATAVYFAQPLYEKLVSDAAFWWTLFAVVAAGAVFLVVRSLQLSHTLWPRVLAAAVAILIVAPSLYAAHQLTSRPYQWQPYSDSALAAARAQGRPVLVDFTATWCGNCHFVEAFVLKDPRIVQAVRNDHVVMLKADVTDDDAPARPLLGQLNPAGAIPLTAVYAPAAGKPQLLAGIYNVNDLLAVLKQAS